jgi:hypothetical protein
MGGLTLHFPRMGSSLGRRQFAYWPAHLQRNSARSPNRFFRGNRLVRPRVVRRYLGDAVESQEIEFAALAAFVVMIVALTVFVIF